MEGSPGLRQQRERLRRLLRRAEALLGQTDIALDDMTAQTPTPAALVKLDRLRSSLETTVRDYLQQNAAFMDYVRDELRKIEETSRKTAMSEQRAKPARDEDRIQKLSEELTRELRLERIDAALKELLDFLSDAEFFAANATVGRKRRLKALQNAIDKALQK